MDLFGMIKSIYTKVPVEYDMAVSPVVLTKWLARDKDNIEVLKLLTPYHLHLDPKHYYYMLFIHIPYKAKPPYFGKGVTKKKKKANKMVDKVQEVLGWSNRELELEMNFVDKNILSDKKKWKKELGL